MKFRPDCSVSCIQAQSTCVGQYQGRLEPYSIYIPHKTRPAGGWGMTLLMHSLSANYNQYHGSRNQIQFGNNFRASAQPPPPTIYDGVSIRPGWQGIAGLSYAITPQIAVAVDGRIKGSFGHFNFTGSVPGKSITQFNYETRSVFVSVRYAFGG